MDFKVVEERVKRLRENTTPAEAALMDKFDRAGVKYVFQQYMEGDGWYRIVDFFIPIKNIIVELDGSHHYDSKKQYIWDLRKDAYFSKIGYKVARITNSQAYKLTASEIIKMAKRVGLNHQANSIQKKEAYMEERRTGAIYAPYKYTGGLLTRP